jgi:hypothetical protein
MQMTADEGSIWPSRRWIKKTRWFTFHQVKTKKEAASRCRIYWAHKQRNETSFVCLTCSVALCKILCFGEYHTKKNYWTGMQKLKCMQTYSMSYYFFWRAAMSYLHWCKKLNLYSRIFDIFFKRPVRIWVKFRYPHSQWRC